MSALGPHAVHQGSSSMNSTTLAHAACLAAAVLIRRAHRTAPVPAAIKVALMENSQSSRSIYLPPCLLLRTNVSSRSSSFLSNSLASTMPLTNSSREPRQKRSMIWRTARAAKLLADSTAR